MVRGLWFCSEQHANDDQHLDPINEQEDDDQ
jgi:hypothetical protein